MVGRSIPEVMGEEAFTLIKPHIERVLRGEPVEFAAQIPYADGLKYVSVNYSPERDDGGNVVGWVASITDVSERERAEQALRDADRAKDEFLATLAHELRNPLAPIRSAVQILQLKGPPTPESRWASEVINRQVQQMARLIDDLMDVSRITRGHLELRMERVELAKILQDAIETSRPLIDQLGHEISVVVPEEPILVDADSTRLAQVFSNILNNAAKYSRFESRIEITVAQRKSEVVVSVRDQGIGIPTDMLSWIFEPFVQVDRSLERTQGGLGIGLTLVKRLIELHGGSVTAHSDGPGTGSVFTVRVPVAVEAAVARPRGSEPALGVPEHCRVLIVDDNIDAAAGLSIMLEILGYETRTAYDGRAGLAVAAEYRPHVALLDIGMPEMNGYELARRIREQPWGNDVTLVAVTGWGQHEQRELTARAGFEHHLVKPIDVTALQKLLASVMSNAEAT
jgi:signal transduction histidine kinase/CheY-like chemotaxis protein